VTEIEVLDSNSNVGDDGDLEFEATRVELDDNFVIISNDLENGDPFFVVLCNKPLHMCEQTFEDNWGNAWYKGDMILRGVWYDKVSHQQGTNISNMLLIDFGPTYVYSHLVVASKFPMLPSATRKGVQRPCMSLGVRHMAFSSAIVCNCMHT
jgi:hypothetical protein